MRSVYEQRVAEAREIEGRIASGRDNLVTNYKFGAVCKLLWPFKTAAELAVIGKVDERTAKRWLAGEYEPPRVVLRAVINKMFHAYPVATHKR